jgi:hypothetical protein
VLFNMHLDNQPFYFVCTLHFQLDDNCVLHFFVDEHDLVSCSLLDVTKIMNRLEFFSEM